MLMPKKTKFRKVHRGRRRGETKGQSTVQFGDYGLKAIDRGWITNRQIEAARIAMTRKIKRGGKVWINVFPDKPFTKKPAETRMGSGKGSPEGWVAVVKPGRVMFELAGVPEPLAKEALRLAGNKLPVAVEETETVEEPAAKPEEPVAEAEPEPDVEAAAAAAEAPVEEAPAEEPQPEPKRKSRKRLPRPLRRQRPKRERAAAGKARKP